SSSTPVNYDICPSGWRLPTSAELTTLKNSYSTGTALTGSPFLGVYAGFYFDSQFLYGGSSGYYWSSTAYNSNYAYYLGFNSSSANVDSNYKGNGLSVRCVKEPTMQEATQAFLAAAMPNDGDTTNLVDSRNGEEYSIAKINNQYWMTKNLSLGKSTTTKLTQDDSNVSSSGYTLPASSTSGFSSDTAANVYNSGSTTCSSSSACYSYYTWKAATAGSTKSTDGQNADYDICPKGWRLPTQAELTTLKDSYTTGNTLTASPFLGVYAGLYSSSQLKSGSGGSSGYYWSSTAYSSGYARSLFFDSSSATVGVYTKKGGRAVRCIFKS
ncbi:DUF1566 domain-containing protein, partial [Candidatus Saccharibacteria bacterium]|nr:DUF1566 domain-containing protein [Candidatus Saccharibacteria bacterium]